MNEVENEDLVFTLETIVDKFGEEMAPYALGLCQNLVCPIRYLNLVLGNCYKKPLFRGYLEQKFCTFEDLFFHLAMAHSSSMPFAFFYILHPKIEHIHLRVLSILKICLIL
jgi:hypothetical protein